MGRVLDQVAPGVWVTTAARWSTTSTVVVADDGACVLIDPALSPDELDGLADELDARGWRAEGAVATHAHWDHVLWSARLPDVPRWASGRTAARVTAQAAELTAQAEDEHAGHGAAVTAGLLALPGDVVPWSGPLVRVVEHDAHVAGHLALHVVEAGVLVVGDMLSDTEVPLLDLDSPDPVAAYRTGLTLLREVRTRGVDVLVPGHGGVARGATIDRRFADDEAYLDALDAAVRQAERHGAPLPGRSAPAPDDRRLLDPWVAGQHADQVAALVARHATAPVGPDRS